MNKSLLNWATALVVAGAMALPVMAQAPAAGGFGGAGGAGGGRGGRGAGGAGGAGGGRGGRGGGAGGFNQDPATRVEAMRTTLGEDGKDDEWKVLSAKIVKVLTDQQMLAAGTARAGRGGRGGGGAAPAPAADNPLATAAADLNAAVATGTAATDADLKTKLTAVRDSRSKLSKQLETDQADLQKVVTVRQEAVLVSQGILE